MLRITMLSALLFLAACTTTKGSFCALSKPIRLSEQTVATMTDSEVADALRHNELGQKLCHWKP